LVFAFLDQADFLFKTLGYDCIEIITKDFLLETTLNIRQGQKRGNELASLKKKTTKKRINRTYIPGTVRLSIATNKHTVPPATVW